MCHRDGNTGQSKNIKRLTQLCQIIKSLSITYRHNIKSKVVIMISGFYYFPSVRVILHSNFYHFSYLIYESIKQIRNKSQGKE